MDPLTLTPEEEQDLRALMGWAYFHRPGIPQTAVLGALWSKLCSRVAQAAGEPGDY